MSIETFGGRKVVLGLTLALLGLTVDVVAPNGLSANLKELLIYIGGGFFLGNGIEHVAAAAAAHAAEPSDAGEAMAAELAELKAQGATTQQAINTIGESLAALLRRVMGHG